MDTTTLVTGASSGIGLALVTELLKSTSISVAAASRSAERCGALQQLTNAYPGRLTCIAADITTGTGLARLAETCAALTAPLARVINCVGVLEDSALNLRAEKRLSEVRPEALLNSFRVNAFAPLLLAQALLPVIRRQDDSVFASLSARVGSIADNRLGGWYSYRGAKAAQNQLLRTLALEMQRSAPRTRLVILHPGTTDTPLSARFQRGLPEGQLHSPSFTARRLLDILERTTLDDHGRFMDWRGEDIPW